jgi:hypothetical protein
VIRRLAAALPALLLAACPLPQPLPEYPEGQPVTPPRIVTASVAFPETVVRVPADCAVEPVISLTADLIDANTVELVEARWFVNYDPENQDRRRPHATQVPPDDDPLVIRRVVPPFPVEPYDYAPLTGAFGGAPGAVHVVELVVSNGFVPPEDEAEAPVPNRSALPGYETQVYRWVLLTVPESQASLPCPEAP